VDSRFKRALSAASEILLPFFAWPIWVYDFLKFSFNYKMKLDDTQKKAYI